MSRARILADYVSSGDELADKAPLASPTFTGTATFSGDIVPSTPLSHRNMIINGAMNVYQRGSLAITQTNNGGFALDRFQYWQSGSMGQWLGTMSQHAMSDAEVVSTGHINALKIITTTVENAIGSDEFAYLYYKIEAQDCQRLCYGRSNTKTATLSFWAKSKVAGTYAVSLYQSDGANIIGQTYTLVADTWKKIEMTFTGNTISAIANDSGEGLAINWALIGPNSGDYTSGDNTSWGAYAANKIGYGHNVTWGTSTSHDFYLTGVQLELGSNATPFEHRSYGDELAMCQRYYASSYSLGQPIGTADRKGAIAELASRNHATITPGIQFPVQMRAEPTVAVYDSVSGSGAGNVYNGTTKTSTAGNISMYGFEYISITSGVTTAGAHWHYTALSEL
jgi:hypothetical protein